MITVNYNILKEIYDANKLANEIYIFLMSVIDGEIKKGELMDDNKVSSCIDELLKL